MTNSRSNATKNRLAAAVVVLAAILGVCGTVGVAHAGKKRVVVVLDFEGPKADRFHADLVKLIKKTHTVLSTDKWNGTAEEIDAGTASERDIQRVAKRLNVDAIIEGKIEKRRDEFIIRLKLHDGHSGKLVGASIDTKSEGPGIDSKAQRDIKDELVDAIDNLDPDRAVAADEADKPTAKRTDEESDKPAKKSATKAEEDEPPAKKRVVKKAGEDEAPAKKAAKKGSEDEAPAKKVAKRTEDDEAPAKKVAKRTEDDEAPAKKAAKRTEDDEAPAKKVAKQPEDEEAPAKKLAKKADDEDGSPAAKKAEDGLSPAKEDRRSSGKKVASREDREDRGERDEPRGLVEPGLPQSVGERALDAIAGISVTQRQLSFSTRAGLTNPPPGYNGSPVAGAMVEATLYPFALSHTRTDQLRNIGLTVAFDRVLKIESKNAAGMVFATTEQRYGVGLAFRHAFGHSVTAPVVLGTFSYSSQEFTLVDAAAADVPNVKYSIFEPGLGLRWPLTPRWIAGLDAGLMLITDTGEIQQQTQYGTASIFGAEGAVSVDYLITRNIFARAAFRFESVNHSFQGNGLLSNSRDGNAATTDDVSAARDNYIGGIATVGYAY